MNLSDMEPDYEVFDDYLTEVMQTIDLDSIVTEKPENRFHKCNSSDLLNFYEARQCSSTKKNTTWGLKIFQGIDIRKCFS